jgi:hypothetical protein
MGHKKLRASADTWANRGLYLIRTPSEVRTEDLVMLPFLLLAVASGLTAYLTHNRGKPRTAKPPMARRGVPQPAMVMAKRTVKWQAKRLSSHR